MRVLLWHGYLLAGTGSNIQTANLARSWREAGHDVLLMCQERHGEGFDFVDEQGDFASDNTSFATTSTGIDKAKGRCVLARPSIGEILPVYVYDEYEGFTAKRFVDLTDEELAAYIDANVEALVSAIEQHRPIAIVVGHEVMGPYIAKLACERTGQAFSAKLHGSALEYAVKLQERYRHYAEAGLSAAKVVFGASRYMIDEAARVVPGWEGRGVVINPGCDVDLFTPMERSAEQAPVVGYVGKFIPQKGVHLLLTALGRTNQPGLKAVIVGYGSFGEELETLWDALRSGDRTLALKVARRGPEPELLELMTFLESPELNEAYFERCASIEVTFPGRLEHGPLSKVLPTFDVLCVPSVLPEAFGMVAAEAAACGVLPIVPNHSGIGEAGAAVEEAIGSRGLLTFDTRDPVREIARAINRVLAIPAAHRRELGARAAGLARERWAWPRLAERLLDHAAR